MTVNPYRTSAAHEKRLRRRVRKKGYALTRSCWRRGSIDNLGGLMIIDPLRDCVVWGSRWSLTPADVEAWLAK